MHHLIVLHGIRNYLHITNCLLVINLLHLDHLFFSESLRVSRWADFNQDAIICPDLQMAFFLTVNEYLSA